MTSRRTSALGGVLCLLALLACRVGTLDTEVPFGPAGEPQAGEPQLLPKGSPLPPDLREIALIEVSTPPDIQTTGAYEPVDECRPVRPTLVADIQKRAAKLGCNAVVEISFLCTPLIARMRGICIYTNAGVASASSVSAAPTPSDEVAAPEPE